jgi:hypothetical protein
MGRISLLEDSTASNMAFASFSVFPVSEKYATNTFITPPPRLKIEKHVTVRLLLQGKNPVRKRHWPISSNLCNDAAIDCAAASDGSIFHAGSRAGDPGPLFQAGTIGKYDL